MDSIFAAGPSINLHRPGVRRWCCFLSLPIARSPTAMFPRFGGWKRNLRESRLLSGWFIPTLLRLTEGVLRHQTDYGLAGATLVGPSQWLLAAGARPSVTPEAAVMVPGKGLGNSSERALRTVYLGRIDNRYVDIGRERPRATRHDLEDAITAVLDHQDVAPPGGPPVGCGVISAEALGKR